MAKHDAREANDIVESMDGSVFVRADDQNSVDVGEETVVLGEKTGTYYRLEGVGQTIWELIDSPKALDEIVESITTQYSVTAEEARSDARKFLTALHQEGLVLVRHSDRAEGTH